MAGKEHKWLSKVDEEKKVIIINWSIKATPAEEKKVEYYTKAGYILKDFSEKRAKKMTEKADRLSAAQIREELKADEKALKNFNDMLSAEGFFKAKSWYMHDYKGVPRKPKKEAKK